MADSLRAKLPPVYAPLLGDFFDRQEVVEDRATCESCAMCDHGQGVGVAMEFFHPDAKCCTYYPQLPNYLVGALLSDPAPELEEGRRRLRETLRTRIGATPQWLAPPRKYTVLLAASRGAFGRSKVMRCPYFDAERGGTCTIWKYRENVCNTYFCKYTKGKPGWDFWQSLKDYLGQVEIMLSNYALKRVDPELNEPQLSRLRLTVEDLEDRGPNDADYASYWGKWVGREEEYYVATFEAVKRLSRAEFVRNVDESEEGRKRLAEVRARWEALDRRTVPPILLKNPKLKTYPVDDGIVVTSYNPFDSFKMERELFDVLGLLRAGDTIERNLARLREEHEVDLDPELIAYLYTHGVLVAPGEDPSKPTPAVVSAAPTPAGISAAPGEGGRAPSKVKRGFGKKRR